MAYRFTNTDKWNDSWFSELDQLEKLLFLYLADNCDIAGFIEINLKRWAFELGSNPSAIKGALKGLQRGLIISNCGECLYLKNFLKHQKNLPLNKKNKAHIGIFRRFELYSQKFEIQDIETFIEGGSKGLSSPSGIGNGNGNGNGNGVKDAKKRFAPPTIEEVKNYCLERKNSVDAIKWHDHYTSNGWMVGKNRMKDWKAAVRTWEKNNFQTDGQKSGQILIPSEEKKKQLLENENW